MTATARVLLLLFATCLLSGCMTEVYTDSRVRQERTTIGEIIGVTFLKTHVETSGAVNGVRGLDTFGVGMQFGLWAPLGVYQVAYPIDQAAIRENAGALTNRMLGN